MKPGGNLSHNEPSGSSIDGPFCYVGYEDIFNDDERLLKGGSSFIIGESDTVGCIIGAVGKGTKTTRCGERKGEREDAADFNALPECARRSGASPTGSMASRTVLRKALHAPYPLDHDWGGACGSTMPNMYKSAQDAMVE